MKKSNLRKFSLYMCALSSALLLSACPFVSFSAEAEEVQSRQVYVGGKAAGFVLSTEGVRVVGFCEVMTKEGTKSPAKDCSFKTGDNIVGADGFVIKSTEDLNAALKKSGGKQMTFTVLRSGEKETISACPVMDVGGEYKLGLLIRDSVSGIGTVTYVQKDNLRFGALGHTIVDENSVQLSLSDSNVYLCSVVGANKGVRGKAGELKGLFLADSVFAKADTISQTGIYGTFDSDYDFSDYLLTETAEAEEAHMGKATIYSTINGTKPEEYEISVVKVDKNNKENKNFVIKITDKELLDTTGGIVQGMSGSPIMQDGKLIGAVTHVFLNDPTRGYGIAIENMIGN